MIAIIDYKSGNILSIKNALARLGQAYVVTDEPRALDDADGVIFPGQGRIGQSLAELRKTGMDEALIATKKPFLGICLGMQLLGAYSDEDDLNCLGIFDARAHRFPPTQKVPHLGWNKVDIVRQNALFAGVPNGAYFYFVHSYYFDTVADSSETLGTTDYGLRFASALQKDNFFAVQFHPEKSGAVGSRLLKNFIGLCS